MGANKLLKKLDKQLLEQEQGDQDRYEQIDELLKRIEKKEKKLKKKLHKEKDPGKRKRLKTELKIVALQLKRGAARREELAGGGE
jgi:ribosome-associated translation inhibitor RaiA